MPDANALLAAVGEGTIGAQAVIHQLVASVGGGEAAAEASMAEQPLITGTPRRRVTNNSGVVVDGDPDYEHVRDVNGLPKHLLEEIEHFFIVYKDLEPGKHTSTKGYEGLSVAVRAIEEAQKRWAEHETSKTEVAHGSQKGAGG